jgi:hypothetical protein
MSREEFIAKLQMVYVGDRNAFNEIVGVFDNLKGALQTHEILLRTNIEENQKLNNVLNELKEWFKEFHKYHSRLRWNEVNYIEFIEHLENELKESDNG